MINLIKSILYINKCTWWWVGKVLVLIITFRNLSALS